MAIFHFEIRSIKRSTGQQATGAAAYRAGESIRDERTGNVHNHSRRKDVRHNEIVLPSRFKESEAAWARDRSRLWNTAEAAEKRRDSRVAREYEATLPPELTPEQRLALARSFSRELAERYGVAVDLAIHDPKPGRQSDNFHAHMLTTTREVTPTGLGAKTGLDMHGVARAQRGLSSHVEEYSLLRERWAIHTNQALREANIDARVDHRSLAAQGVERKPLVHVPLEFYQLERRGVPVEAAEKLREDYRARLTAFRERSAEAPAERQPTERQAAERQPAERQATESKTSESKTATESRATTESRVGPEPKAAAESAVVTESGVALQSRDAEAIRRNAVKAWLRMRSKEGESTASATNDAAVSRGSDEERGR